ncbi:unnamed protein product [Euphydryas editha]|uniref:Uncharacterized protein n=1 Tax=Euphydryas editha TaxID=104508 RepID=A0AAU9THP3_EUPED|nr:unnamed protein product [Euphydryas editha]
MKTLFVLCSLATIAIAVPTTLRENLDSFDLSTEKIPNNKREKKSAEHDSPQGLTINDENENTQMRHSHKTKIETTSHGKTKADFKKPIIVKKKLGYRVYRDSDEEMAHADPYENCRRQFKVKLCDGEPMLHTHSKNVQSLLSEGASEIVSEKGMENSIKMAKEAVENLERGIKIIENNSAKKSNSMENIDSGITLQQDIEMAKSALEHIQRRMENLEAIDLQENNPDLKETEKIKSINQWKEAIENIHKNVDISKNIEDAFIFETQDLKQSDNLNVPATSEHEQSSDQKNKYHSNEEYNSNALGLTSNLRPSTTKGELDINESDMFVASTNHKESEVLQSESLTSDNDFNTQSLDNHDNTKVNFNSNHPPVSTKNSEILSLDSDFQKTKMTKNDIPEVKVAENIKMTTLQRSDEENMKFGLSVDSNTKLKNQIDAKNTENSDSKLPKEKYEEELHEHSPIVKSREQIMDQNKSEINMLVNEGISSDYKKDLNELSFKTKDLEKTNIEHHSKESSEIDSLHLSHPKTTLLKENDEKNEDLLQQKHFEIPDLNSLAKENQAKNEQSDVTETLNLHHSDMNHENTHFTSLTAAEPQHEHFPNEFSKMRMNENNKMNQLLNENIDEQLNDFHQSFMRLAQEKQLNDMLMEQFKTLEHSDNEHKMNLHTKNNEIRNEFMPIIDHSSQHIKSIMEFPNDHLHHTSSKTLKNGENSFNERTNMRLIEGMNIDNMGHDLTETQTFNNPLLAERWAQENQHSSHAFKTMSESNNVDMMLTPTNTNEFHSGHHARTENMNINKGTTDGLNLGHLFKDSQEIHDPHSMRWAQDKQHADALAQTFDTAAEFHNKAQLGNSFYESMPTSRMNNNLGLDINQDKYPMRSGTPDNFHVMKNAQAYDMDSTMQPSMQMGMRDSDTQWGHPHHHHHQHHHGLSRSSYSPSQSNSGSNAGAVFSNVNTSCGIPLLLSCSPSIVSGSLTRAQPMGISSPAYRTGENFMHHMKRDANKIVKQNIKVQKQPTTLKQ